MPTELPGGRHVGIELVNRNKRSLAVDLKHPDGRAIVHELVQKADVFFTNYFRNNVLQRVGLDYDTLSALNPRLVYAVTTGWGSKSVEANDRAFAQAVEARLGAMWLTGDQDYDQPFMVHGGTADTMGATLVALGLMTALYDRERTGRGQRVETSLLGAQMHALGHPMNISLLGGASYARHSRRTHSAPFNNFYACRDGEWIFLTEPEADRFWHEYSSLFELDPADPRFSTLDARTHNAVALIQILDKVIAQRTLSEWAQIFRERNVGFAWAPIRRIDDAKTDPVLIDNGYLPWLNHPTLGRVRTLGLPIEFSEARVEPQHAAPDVGEGGDEVLTEWLDASPDRIVALKTTGALL